MENSDILWALNEKIKDMRFDIAIRDAEIKDLKQRLESKENIRCTHQITTPQESTITIEQFFQ